MLEFPPEYTIPGYRITGLIARGGMGQVYAAFDETLQREVAIKTLLPGAPALRFITEAKITARLPHLARSFAEPFAEPRPPGSG
jgi:serine/threonine protein kinase